MPRDGDSRRRGAYASCRRVATCHDRVLPSLANCTDVIYSACCAPGCVAGLGLPWSPAAPGAFPVRKGWVGVAVHERSVWDRYATRRLYTLLAEGRPARGSEPWRRQTAITAQLDKWYPQRRVARHAVESRRIVIRGKVA